MPKVTYLPANMTIELKEGESVLDGALANDIPMAHACGGFCACTTCHIVVKSGEGLLSPMEDEEEERLDRASGVTLHSRLGCQAKVHGTGDIVVEVMNPEDTH